MCASEFKTRPKVPNMWGLLVCWVLLGASSTSQESPQQPSTNATVIDEAFEGFVYEIEASISQRDPKVFDSAVDGDELLRIALKDLDLPTGFGDGLKASMKTSNRLGTQIVVGLGEGGTYEFLRFDEGHESPRARFRMLSNDGKLNYHDLCLRKDEEGNVRIVDVLLYHAGELFSQTLRRTAIAASAQQGLLAKLFGKENPYLAHGNDVRKIRVHLQSGRAKEAYDLIQSLPNELREDKSFSIMEVMAAAELEEAVYLKSLERFERLFPRDPATCLISIDAHLLREDYKAAVRSILTLESHVGGDPYLELLRGTMHHLDGDHERASSVLQVSIAKGNQFEDTYWNLIVAAIALEDFQCVAEALMSLERDFGVQFADLTAIETYAPFVASDEYQVWLRRHDPPDIPLSHVLLPKFEMKDSSYDAGTAFLTQVDGRLVLMTAHHLFGKAGGMPEDLNRDQVREQLRQVSASSEEEGLQPVQAKRLVPLSEAAGDVAALLVAEKKESSPLTLPLAKALPAPGENVWLLSRVMETTGPDPQAHLHRATVWGLDEGRLIYIFVDDLSLRATSGAAVINSNGEVVALNTAGFSDEDGVNGVGEPVTRFGPELTRALDGLED